MRRQLQWQEGNAAPLDVPTVAQSSTLSLRRGAQRRELGSAGRNRLRYQLEVGGML